ncbi:hypothetical protein HIM_01985 [Hirsutella minnesotensis 3608]|nr:hypothetical protein HIM_01985 [Hirsutella minnesotensis 3608]
MDLNTICQELPICNPEARPISIWATSLSGVQEGHFSGALLYTPYICAGPPFYYIGCPEDLHNPLLLYPVGKVVPKPGTNDNLAKVEYCCQVYRGQQPQDQQPETVFILGLDLDNNLAMLQHCCQPETGSSSMSLWESSYSTQSPDEGDSEVTQAGGSSCGQTYPKSCLSSPLRFLRPSKAHLKPRFVEGPFVAVDIETGTIVEPRATKPSSRKDFRARAKQVKKDKRKAEREKLLASIANTEVKHPRVQIPFIKNHAADSAEKEEADDDDGDNGISYMESAGRRLRNVMLLAHLKRNGRTQIPPSRVIEGRLFDAERRKQAHIKEALQRGYVDFALYCFRPGSKMHYFCMTRYAKNVCQPFIASYEGEERAYANKGDGSLLGARASWFIDTKTAMTAPHTGRS